MIVIYAKAPGDKRMHGMDYKAGTTVKQKIHHTMWPKEARGHVQSLVDAMVSMNPGYTFEIRNVR